MGLLLVSRTEALSRRVCPIALSVVDAGVICIREGTGTVGVVGVVGVAGDEGAEGLVGLSSPQLLSIKDKNKHAIMNRFESERMKAIFIEILSGYVDKNMSRRFQALRKQ